MKFISSIFQSIILVVIVGILSYWLSGFNSAFEADQLCHSSLANNYSNNPEFGCDHDTETHQWILYEKNDDSQPAKVIKRFRYKFL
tara:strand:- start:207 stop:464 length:258 start_codon:yes stop_codon:yes gene_type:complete